MATNVSQIHTLVNTLLKMYLDTDTIVKVSTVCLKTHQI